MTEKEIKESDDLPSENLEKTVVREFAIDETELNLPSSNENLKTQSFAEKIQIESEKDYLAKTPDADKKAVEADFSEEIDVAATEEDPIFRELSEPELPELPRENRARLLMQSPTKLNFYWAIKNNPFRTLKRALGQQTGNYTFVVKLLNLTEESEEIFPIDTEGSTWFNVDANASYQAEIGFYAPNRPFIRIMFSNTVETPRRSPSSRRDYSPFFHVSADQFAEVLDVSGFRQDAFEVALAGDDEKVSETATQNAFSQFTETQKSDFQENDSSEMRFALLAVASGIYLENLREQISKNLFSKLMQTSDKLSPEKALAALQKNFGVFSGEMVEERFSLTSVFGASSIHFPQTVRKRFFPKFAPVSSLR